MSLIHLKALNSISKDIKTILGLFGPFRRLKAQIKVTYIFRILGFLYFHNTFPSSKFNIEGNIRDFVVLGLLGLFGPFWASPIYQQYQVSYMSLTHLQALNQISKEKKMILGLFGLFGPFRRL